jgi:hypothetical protein
VLYETSSVGEHHDGDPDAHRLHRGVPERLLRPGGKYEHVQRL